MAALLRTDFGTLSTRLGLVPTLHALVEDLVAMALESVEALMDPAGRGARLPLRIEVPASPEPWSREWVELEAAAEWVAPDQCSPEDAERAVRFALHKVRPLLEEALGASLVAMYVARRAPLEVSAPS